MDHLGEGRSRDLVAALDTRQRAALLHLVRCRRCRAEVAHALQRQSALEDEDYRRVLARAEAAGDRLAARVVREVEAAGPLCAELLQAPQERWADLCLETRFHTVAVVGQLVLHAARQRPGDPIAAITTAGLALDLTNQLEAGPHATVARELRVRAWCVTAVARQQMGDLPRSREALRYAARHLGKDQASPARAVYCRALGRLRAEQKRLDEALALTGRAVQLFADSAEHGDELGESLTDQGWLLLDAGDPEASEAVLRRALGAFDAATPAALHSKALHALALCHADLGRPELAEETLASARALLPDDRRERLRLVWLAGRVAFRSGQERQAEELLHEAFRGLLADGAHFDAALACLDLAAVHAASGRHQEIWHLEQEALALRGSPELSARAVAVLQFALLMASLPFRSGRELLDNASRYLARSRFVAGLPFFPRDCPLEILRWDDLPPALREHVCRETGAVEGVAEKSAAQLVEPQRDAMGWAFEELTGVRLSWGRGSRRSGCNNSVAS